MGLVSNYVTEQKRLDLINEKTGRQYDLVARLMIKVIGENNAHLVDANAINHYRDLLGKLPKNYGKSPRDAPSSLDDILRRAKKLPANQVGLSAATINRHVTQLSAILDEIERRVGDINKRPTSKSIRPKKNKEQRARNSRKPLSRKAVDVLFALPVWTGHNHHI